NVGAFLRLYNLGVAPTGRAADSSIPKISACWVLESLHSCHIQESLDSNVGTFLHRYNCGLLDVFLLTALADTTH
ncbi:hypothetical protein, partial [Photobacterium phosphoreum]|uniref:hypothetical protein n=1 Tax=Photobacterium phosphoreum TaxID=659 RepID=UPI000AE53705